LTEPRNKPADWLVYLALRLVAMFVHMMPLDLVYRVAGAAGNAWYRLDARRRGRALEHLGRSFPAWSARKLDDVARGSFRSMIYLGFELLLTARLITQWRWARFIVLPGNAEIARLLLERKSGLILISGHLGGWEIAGYAMAALGFEGYAVARPLDNPYLNAYLVGARQKRGMKVLDKRGAMEAMDRIFLARDYVGFIADQDAGPTGMFVDFMGRPASTYKAPALMAMRYNVPLAVGCGRRIDERYRFKMEFERVIYPHEWADKDDPLRWITQEYTAALERAIRRFPEQYVWTYRRWKTQPRTPRPTEGTAA